MRFHSTLKFTNSAFQKMTTEQFEAIKKNITNEDVWNAQPYDIEIFWDIGGTLMVKGLSIVIGIEPDGYTHS